MEPKIRLAPQPGPQTQFFLTDADIAIYGGSAGSGKSYALLLEPLRNCLDNPRFAGVIFRRTTPEIRNPGGLWDESLMVYGQTMGGIKGCGGLAIPKSSTTEWEWPQGGKVKFSHLEYDATALTWHGSQIPFIGFDELTTFTQFQFFYLLSRNRSATAGVRPYVRATCNPDADSWVAELISWWINPDTGFPIPERSGVKRYFVRVGDKLVWGDSPDDLHPSLIGAPTHTPDGEPIDYMPKSLTFIAATIADNQALLKGDPNYLANLLALPTVERERLLRGNWKIKPSAGLYFKREWVEIVDQWDIPQALRIKRGWDLAGTPKTQQNDPDFTCGTKIGKTVDLTGIYYVLDHKWLQDTPGAVETTVKNTASQDGRDTEVWIPQDPGQAGKSQVLNYMKLLDGFSVKATPETGDKETRFKPFSSRCEAGFVKVLRAPWNERWFGQLEGFPDLTHDDDVDSTSRAYNAFLDGTTGLIDYYKQAAEEQQRKLLEAAKPHSLADGEAVLVFPPPGKDVNMLYDPQGRAIFCEPNGSFKVSKKHAEMLRRSGFVEAVC